MSTENVTDDGLAWVDARAAELESATIVEIEETGDRWVRVTDPESTYHRMWGPGNFHRGPGLMGYIITWQLPLQGTVRVVA